MQKAIKIIASSTIAGEVSSTSFQGPYKTGISYGESYGPGADPHVVYHPEQATVYKP